MKMVAGIKKVKLRGREKSELVVRVCSSGIQPMENPTNVGFARIDAQEQRSNESIPACFWLTQETSESQDVISKLSACRGLIL
jgi:hypothetical protein